MNPRWMIAGYSLVGLTSVALAQAPTPATIVHRADAGPVLERLGPTHPEVMAAHFINVGQGSAALFEFSCGAVLIDTGGQTGATTDWKAAFKQFLDSFFLRRSDLNKTIDVFYLTHPHPDHSLGIGDLIAPGSYTLRHVITDDQKVAASSPQRRLINYANSKKIPAVQIRVSMISSPLGLTSRWIDPLKCNGNEPDIRVLWGTEDEPHHWPAEDEKDANNHSVAIRIAFGDSSFLVTGDMEGPAIAAMIKRYQANIGVLNTDVYVAGHHGAKNGTTEALVMVMKPEIAVFSAGDPSKHEPGGFSAFHHGHPNRATIALLSDPVIGTTMSRPSVHVGVGIKGQAPGSSAPATSGFDDVDHALFSTGWDGTISIVADFDGTKTVVID